MNWQTELNNSLSWLLNALFWVVLCFVISIAALKQILANCRTFRDTAKLPQNHRVVTLAIFNDFA